MKIASIFIAMIIVSGIAYAQFGAQSFPDVNFGDDVVTEAELDVVETEFSEPGLLPDNPFYFLKRFAENIRLVFTFDPAEKAKLHLNFAKLRLAEAKKLIAENKTAKAKEAAEDFSKELERFENVSRGIGRNVSALAKSEDVLEKSSLVLSLVIEKAPEQAKQALENALNNSIEKKVRIVVENETAVKEKTEKELEEEIEEEFEKERKRSEAIRKEIKQKLRTGKKEIICIQVITPARNPAGECREFPTPCDVPEGWEKVSSCGETGLSGLATIA